MISYFSWFRCGTFEVVTMFTSNCLGSIVIATTLKSSELMQCLAGSFAKISISLVQVSKISKPV